VSNRPGNGWMSSDDISWTLYSYCEGPARGDNTVGAQHKSTPTLKKRYSCLFLKTSGQKN